jgi:hypothetical protein
MPDEGHDEIPTVIILRRCPLPILVKYAMLGA